MALLSVFGVRGSNSVHTESPDGQMIFTIALNLTTADARPAAPATSSSAATPPRRMGRLGSRGR